MTLSVHSPDESIAALLTCWVSGLSVPTVTSCSDTNGSVSALACHISPRSDGIAAITRARRRAAETGLRSSGLRQESGGSM
jgi:hypothetical protein